MPFGYKQTSKTINNRVFSLLAMIRRSVVSRECAKVKIISILFVLQEGSQLFSLQIQDRYYLDLDAIPQLYAVRR